MKYLYMLSFQYAYEIRETELVQVSFGLGIFSTRQKAQDTIPYYLSQTGFCEYSEDEFRIDRFEIDKKYIPARFIEVNE